jgi:hypothetical protein
VYQGTTLPVKLFLIQFMNYVDTKYLWVYICIMIKAKDTVKEFVRNQADKTELCKRWQISRQTLYNLLGGDDVSAETIAHILNDTGFEFEKAFEVRND